jgi:hypothetical protein
MRPALRIVHREEAVAPVAVPWWRRRGVVVTAKMTWWLVTFLFWLAVAVIFVAGLIILGLLTALGVGSHFAGESK